jgi:hypothetical protein
VTDSKEEEKKSNPASPLKKEEVKESPQKAKVEI